VGPLGRDQDIRDDEDHDGDDGHVITRPSPSVATRSL
jgi:hypothetical protein